MAMLLGPVAPTVLEPQWSALVSTAVPFEAIFVGTRLRVRRRRKILKDIYTHIYIYIIFFCKYFIIYPFASFCFLFSALRLRTSQGIIFPGLCLAAESDQQYSGVEQSC